MFLLAGISTGQKITIIALCVAIFLFILADVILLVSLYKRDKRLERRKKLLAGVMEKVSAARAKREEEASEAQNAAHAVESDGAGIEENIAGSGEETIENPASEHSPSDGDKPFEVNNAD